MQKINTPIFVPGLVGMAIIAMVPLCTANAQAVADDRLEEIVVTALRRETSLQVTPVSISAFVASDFEKLSIRNVGEVISYTPNVVTTSGPTGHNDGFYFIRGIGNVDLNPATDPGVATYVDGVYLGRVTGANMDALNIARVEVLRGPQGTLFGRNTIGGAISIVTRDPGEQFAANVQAVAGSDSRFNLRAGLDTPLSDELGLTLSALHQSKDGRGVQVDTGETFGDIDNFAARLKLVYSPSDTVSASLSADYSSSEGTSAHNILVDANPMAVSPLAVPLPADLGNDIPSNIDDNYNSIDPVHDTTSSGISLTLDGDLGAVGFRSITAFRQVEQLDANDFDGSRYTFYDHFFDTDADQFSQEFQLLRSDDRMSWVLGGYFFSESAFHNNAIAMGGNNGVPPGIPMVPYATHYVQRRIVNNQRFDIDIDAVAVFLHLTYNFTDRFSGTLGLRWTDEEKEQRYDFSIDNTDDVFNFAGLPPIEFATLSPNNPFLTIPSTYQESWSESTPKAGLEYSFSDSAFGYLSYARGFRSGGFNGRPTPNQMGQFAEVQAYDPEISDSYELGIKTEWFDKGLRVNASVFHTIYQDIQLLVLGSSGFFETENAAEAEISGLEIELIGRTANDFEVMAGIGIMDNEYTELDPGTVASGITTDNKLPNAPDQTINVGVQKTFGLARGSSLSFRADYIWQDDVYFNATNLPGEFQESYGVVNARVAYRSPDDALEIALYGLNIGDEDYFVNGQDVVGPLGVAFMGVGPEMEYGLEVSYSFGNW